MLKPGASLNGLTLRKSSPSDQGPPLWAFCPPAFSSEPGKLKVECSLPPLPGLGIGHGWFARDESTRDANWSAMQWELFLDEKAVDLGAFGSYDADLPQGGLPGMQADQEVITKLRSFDVLVENLTLGQHSLRSVLHLSQPVDNGLEPEKPAGDYELLVVFTVEEPPLAATFTAKPLPSATPQPIIFQVKDLVGVWRTNYQGQPVYINYKPDGSWMISPSAMDLEENPVLTGTYSVEGQTLMIQDAECGQAKFELSKKKSDGTRTGFNLKSLVEICKPRFQDSAIGYTWVAATQEPGWELAPQIAIWLAFHDALSGNNIELALSFVAEDAVMRRGPYGIGHNREELRGIFHKEVEDNTKFNLFNCRVNGDWVACDSRVFVGGHMVDSYTFPPDWNGDSGALIQNGKIKQDLLSTSRY
jgi:hypothetical protein